MNAYELADELEKRELEAMEYGFDKELFDAANMLRQQADRIVELEKENWLVKTNTAQATLKQIIDLLVLHHDTLACSSYPMERKPK